MKNLFILATTLIALTGFSEIASAKKAAKPAPAAAKVDVTGNLNWTGFGVGKTHHGEIALKSGYAEMKGTELVGGTFVLDMTSLKTSDSPKLQGHLRSADFFDVEKNPEGTFKITKVEPLKDVKAGEPTHKITGDLTIKGKTHPQDMLVTLVKKGDKWEATGEAEIKDRTQYDIVYNSAQFKAASVLGDKLISDNIKITLNVATK